MHIQPDLFSPMLARSHHRQAQLFDQASAIDADSDLTCIECGAKLVRTDGYLCCPSGHGRLIECTVSTVDLAIDRSNFARSLHNRRGAIMTELQTAIAGNRARHHPISTPWGISQTRKRYGRDGIEAVTTAGHGGFYVPAHLVGSIPAHLRRWAAHWSGSEQWYEEDCCWAAVAVTWPELFPAEALPHARRIIAEYAGIRGGVRNAANPRGMQ
jgi:hypothetical protein